jgi:hypothetical protein
VRPFWAYLVALLGFAVVAAPLGLLTPIPLQIAVDTVIGDRPPPGWLVGLWPWVAGLSAPKPFCAPAAERRLLSDLNDNTGGDSDENGRRKEVSE